MKNTICDLKKHIIGERQKADNSVVFVPIFRVYTNMDSSNPNKIRILHDPSEDDFIKGIQEFISKITKTTENILRLEYVFRDKRIN